MCSNQWPDTQLKAGSENMNEGLSDVAQSSKQLPSPCPIDNPAWLAVQGSRDTGLLGTRRAPGGTGRRRWAQEADQVRMDQGAMIVEGQWGQNQGGSEDGLVPTWERLHSMGVRRGVHALTPHLVGVHSGSFNLRSHLVYKWGH